MSSNRRLLTILPKKSCLIQKRRERQNQRQPTLKKHQNYVFKFVEAPVGLKNNGKSSIMSLKSSLCKDRSKMPKDVDIKQ